MPTFSFIGEAGGGEILSTAMSESFFAKHISPQPSEEASNEAIVDLTKKSSPGEANKENVQHLLAEVSRTWTAGKGNRQTKQAKAAVKIARESGLAPSKIAKHVVDDLNQRNQPTDGEGDRVKEFAYNINKQLKKERETTAAATQKTAATHSTASTDLALDEETSGAPTNLEDLFPAGIPYQRNGVIYSQGDKLNNKRKSSVLEQSSAKTTKKQNVESMNQERHWMTMWKDARTELKKLREELKNETDDEVLAELKTDIECLQKKKDEWAKLMGMKE